MFKKIASFIWQAIVSTVALVVCAPMAAVFLSPFIFVFWLILNIIAEAVGVRLPSFASPTEPILRVYLYLAIPSYIVAFIWGLLSGDISRFIASDPHSINDSNGN